MSYRRLLWGHKPLTDFWRVGRGYAKRLEAQGIYTMGDIARCSLGGPGDYYNEDLLYKMFGVNAELLIDHAWGFEPCRMEDIKAYKPENSSMGSGQVLQCAYDFQKAKLVLREMTEQLVLELVDKGLVTDQMVLAVSFDRSSLANPEIRKTYKGEVSIDHHGREYPKHAHSSVNLGRKTASTKVIIHAVMELYDRIVDKNLLVRRINIAANHVVEEEMAQAQETVTYEQMNLFTDYEALRRKQEEEKKALERERKLQQTMLDIKKKYGKNAILKGMNLEEGATARERNNQIGGHKA